MRKFLFILLLLPFIGHAQDTKTPFANTATPVANRYAFTNNGLWVDSTVKFVKYRQVSDTVLMGVDANGKVYTITKTQIGLWGGGSGSTITATNGLTLSSDTIKLGGTLVDAVTTIDADSKDFRIDDAEVIRHRSNLGSDGEQMQHFMTNQDMEYRLLDVGTPTDYSLVWMDWNGGGRNNFMLQSQGSFSVRTGIHGVGSESGATGSPVNDGTLIFEQTAGNFHWDGLTNATNQNRLLGVTTGSNNRMGSVVIGNGLSITSGVALVDSGKFTTRWRHQKAIDSLALAANLQMVTTNGDSTTLRIKSKRLVLGNIYNNNPDTTGTILYGFNDGTATITTSGQASMNGGVMLDTGSSTVTGLAARMSLWNSGGTATAIGWGSTTSGVLWKQAVYGLSPVMTASGTAARINAYVAQTVPSWTSASTAIASSSGATVTGLIQGGSTARSIDGATNVHVDARDSSYASATENSAWVIAALEGGGQAHSDGAASMAGGMANKGKLISGIGLKGMVSSGVTTHGSFLWASTGWFGDVALARGEGSVVHGIAYLDSLVAWDSAAVALGQNVKNYGKWSFGFGKDFRMVQDRHAVFGWNGSRVFDFYGDDGIITLWDDADTLAAMSVVRTLYNTLTNAYIQNQNASAQTSSNYWISGTGRANIFAATGANNSALTITNTNTSTTTYPRVNFSITGQSDGTISLVPKDASVSLFKPWTNGARGNALLFSSPGNTYFVNTGTAGSPRKDFTFYTDNGGGLSTDIDSVVKFGGDGNGFVSIYHPQTYSPLGRDTVLSQNLATGALERVRVAPPDTTVVDNTGTLTLGTRGNYVFSGTTATWTFPPVAGNTGVRYFVINRGSGVLTLNSNSGGNDIYVVPTNTGGANTTTISAGAASWFVCDGTYWNQW